jgi:putative membrane protein
VPAIWRRFERPQPSSGGGDDATVKAADLIYRKIKHKPLSPDEKKVAGPFVHYTFGAVLGAFYGGISTLVPSISGGMGAAYGAVIWLLVDETVVPAMGLSELPEDYPASTHVMALISHLVCGVTVDRTTRLAERAMEDTHSPRTHAAKAC